MTKKLITLCLVLIASIATAQTGTKTNRYEVDEFNKIIIDGGGTLQIYHSDNHTIGIKDNNGCDEIVDFHVSSKTLYIKVNGPKIPECGITIRVGVSSLVELVQNGGGKVVINKGFSPQNSFVCEIKGGGDTDVSELSVNSFSAAIKGGGVMSLHAEKELDGNISGGGLIKYSGHPKVTSHVSGGGAINKR